MVSHMRVPPGGNSQNIPPIGIYPLGVCLDTSGMCLERFANVYGTESGCVWNRLEMCMKHIRDVCFEQMFGVACVPQPDGQRSRCQRHQGYDSITIYPDFLGMPIGPVSRPLASFSAHLHMTGMSCACRLLGRMPTRFRYAYALPDT